MRITDMGLEGGKEEKAEKAEKREAKSDKYQKGLMPGRFFFDHQTSIGESLFWL